MRLLLLLAVLLPLSAEAKALDLAQVKRLVQGRGFTVVQEGPFIVVGDQSPDRVRKWATGTVRWARRRLRDAYFATDPRGITIWLFGHEESYREHARLFFGHEPSTPFGYYSSEHRALVMNIATGGGTLVHEMVHPYIEANFRRCPAWFNEGLGSLYEQSADRSGRIVGLVNWRLRGLQSALKESSLPTFRELLATTDAEFYDEDPGTNYAQARYLLLYLQERGKLHRFYRAFHADRRADPTGYHTLERVLSERDMTDFQRRWEAWAASLTL